MPWQRRTRACPSRRRSGRRSCPVGSEGSSLPRPLCAAAAIVCHCCQQHCQDADPCYDCMQHRSLGKLDAHSAARWRTHAVGVPWRRFSRGCAQGADRTRWTFSSGVNRRDFFRSAGAAGMLGMLPEVAAGPGSRTGSNIVHEVASPRARTCPLQGHGQLCRLRHEP